MSALTLERPAHRSAKLPEMVRLADISRRDPELAGGWRDLVETAPDGLVEMHPEMVLAAGPTNADSTPGLLLHASGEDGELASLAVLMEKTVSLPVFRGLPWRAPLRGLRLVGSRLLGSDADAAIPAFAAGLERLLSGPTARYACLLLEDLPTESLWWQAFDRHPRTQAVTLAAPQTRWFLRFPDSADAYWSRFSSKTRYNFRRQKRLFDHQWESVTEAAQVAAFLDDASAVSARSWQGKRLGLRVRSSESLLRQFGAMADLQALRCYLLRSQGEPVAFAIGTQWNGRYVLEEIGYDTRYADYSPGTVLLLNMLEDMFQRDTPELLDFGFGDGAYKQLFGNESTESGTLLVVSRRFGPTLALGLSRLGNWLEQAARSGLRVSGLDSWIRKIYRR